MEQLTTTTIGFSIYEPSSSSPLVKRSQGDSSSTLVEEGSSKHDCLSKGDKHEALTHFFRLHVILSSRVRGTLEEFVIVVANEDLAFVRNSSVTDK